MMQSQTKSEDEWKIDSHPVGLGEFLDQNQNLFTILGVFLALVIFSSSIPIRELSNSLAFVLLLAFGLVFFEINKRLNSVIGPVNSGQDSLPPISFIEVCRTNRLAAFGLVLNAIAIIMSAYVFWEFYYHLLGLIAAILLAFIVNWITSVATPLLRGMKSARRGLDRWRERFALVDLFFYMLPWLILSGIQWYGSRVVIGSNLPEQVRYSFALMSIAIIVFGLLGIAQMFRELRSLTKEIGGVVMLMAFVSNIATGRHHRKMYRLRQKSDCLKTVNALLEEIIEGRKSVVNEMILLNEELQWISARNTSLEYVDPIQAHYASAELRVRRQEIDKRRQALDQYVEELDSKLERAQNIHLRPETTNLSKSKWSARHIRLKSIVSRGWS